MRVIVAVCMMVGLCFASSIAQNHEQFLERCIGDWTGTMHILKEGVRVDSINVTFEVQPIIEENALTWNMSYQSDPPMSKDYILRPPEGESNKFIIDEQNGIGLEAYLFGNKLHSAFAVQGTILTSSYELVGDELIFEVVSGPQPNKLDSGVVNIPVLNVQRVRLSHIDMR